MDISRVHTLAQNETEKGKRLDYRTSIQIWISADNRFGFLHDKLSMSANFKEGWSTKSTYQLRKHGRCIKNDDCFTICIMACHDWPGDIRVTVSLISFCSKEIEGVNLPYIVGFHKNVEV